MPLADLALKNDDATSVGTLKYFDAGDGKIYPVSMLYVGVAGVPTQVGDSQALPVSAASLPLPTGAATAANQATEIASLASIDGKITAVNTGAVVVSSSALPTGASTLAEQQSQTTQLTRVAGKYVDFDTGGGTDSVVAIGLLLPGNGGAVIGGTSSNPIRTDPTGTTTQPISAASLPLPTGAATDANQVTLIGHVDGIEALLTTIDASATAIAGSANIMDDWDEVDRCKVNLIVGQAGITAGAGAVGLNTPRMTLASDDPAVVSLAAIDNAVSGNGFNITQFGGNNVSTGNGVSGTGVIRVTMASDSTGILAGITTVTTVTTVSTVTTLTGGGVASGSADSGNPVKVGGRAKSADITAEADNDRLDLIQSLVGKLLTIPYALPGQTWSYAAASGGITNTTGVTAKAAAGAGIRNYVTSCQVINGHATVDTDVQIRDGASGTVLHRGFAKAAGGGFTCAFDPPLRGTANTLIEIACGTTGSATYVNLQGYTAAE